jgi:hypothetical protein
MAVERYDQTRAARDHSEGGETRTAPTSDLSGEVAGELPPIIVPFDPKNPSLPAPLPAVLAEFPMGMHYDHVVVELKMLLPETIDDRLRDVGTYCDHFFTGMGGEWRAHIVGEVAGILQQLRSFRTTCLLLWLKSLGAW